MTKATKSSAADRIVPPKKPSQETFDQLVRELPANGKPMGSALAARPSKVGAWSICAVIQPPALPAELPKSGDAPTSTTGYLSSPATFLPTWRSRPKSWTRSFDFWATTLLPSSARADRPVHKGSHALNDAAIADDVFYATVAA